MSSFVVVFTSLSMALGVYAATAPSLTARAEEKTAQSQSMSKTEVETTRLIRERITDTEKLSVRAQNIKIITQHGRIYLKGPVASKEERELVGKIAKQAANEAKVINETYVEK